MASTQEEFDYRTYFPSKEKPDSDKLNEVASAVDKVVHTATPDDLRNRFFGFINPDNVAGDITGKNAKNKPRDIVLVAFGGKPPEAVGYSDLAKFSGKDGKTKGDFGVLVPDKMKGNGIGKRLVQGIVRTAADDGVDELESNVLATNRRMLERHAKWFDEMGFPSKKVGTISDGEYTFRTQLHRSTPDAPKKAKTSGTVKKI